MPDKADIARQGLGAMAAEMQMRAAILEAEAAAIIGDSEGLEAARQRAHDLLDAQIDFKTAAHVGLTRKLR